MCLEVIFKVGASIGFSHFSFFFDYYVIKCLTIPHYKETAKSTREILNVQSVLSSSLSAKGGTIVYTNVEFTWTNERPSILYKKKVYILKKKVSISDKSLSSVTLFSFYVIFGHTVWGFATAKQKY